jgi:CheY-like chemotaxis protein
MDNPARAYELRITTVARLGQIFRRNNSDKRCRIKEGFPRQIDVPDGEPAATSGVEKPGRSPCAAIPCGLGDASAYVDIAQTTVICEPLGLNTGKDIVMTATRPPGGSVFLVEDEVMIRMMVADMLEELGYSVVAEAGEIGQAIKLAQSAEFDFAILDVNVNGKVISPVADLIRARNRPFIFATGYGSSGLPPEYRDRPALQKPFQIETLARIIDTALKSATV